jgi:hypothetical protein
MVTILLIYLPLYELTGFVPPGIILFATLILISLIYLFTTEWLKGWFYRRMG